MDFTLGDNLIFVEFWRRVNSSNRELKDYAMKITFKVWDL